MGVRGGDLVDLVDGDVVSIRPPDQGGYVVYLGARARNVHGLTAKITAAVRDPSSPRVISLEQRPVRLIGGDGFAVPESRYQDLANVPVCSTVEGPADFDGSMWRLEVQLSDADGRQAEVHVLIRPECDEQIDPFGCACACDADGLPAGSCREELDAGVDA